MDVSSDGRVRNIVRMYCVAKRRVLGALATECEKRPLASKRISGRPPVCMEQLCSY